MAWVKDEVDGSADAMYKAKFRDIANLNAIASVIEQERAVAEMGRGEVQGTIKE